ncbi:hypothetical protein ABIC86_000119 [Paenibacillus sp. DS2363]|uniref:hypothetical protein n=1 Tax=Paenibacillus sp. DS2363 TaxID=3156427 RepID=UPI0033990400
MLTERTIRNIHIIHWERFFREFNVPNRTVRIRAESDKYTSILKIIGEELASDSPSFSKGALDRFLFDQLFYSISDHHYLYQTNSIFYDNEMDRESTVRLLSSDSLLKLNLNLFDWPDDNTHTINACTTRLEFDENDLLNEIHVLLRVGEISGEYGRTNVFCGVTISLKTNAVLFKFRHGQVIDMPDSQIKINNALIKVLNGEGRDGKQFESLDLHLSTLNEFNVQSAIYKLFKDLSEEAEEKLNNELDGSAENKIRTFLENELNIKSEKESFNEYVEQIKAVVFQDISSRMTHTLFKKGWVFKFVFREGDHSKASSNAEKRSPVYSYKSFWQLKELIHSIKELQEAGFHWNLNGVESDSEFVDVRLESKSGTLLIHYYYNTRSVRKEKEEYVIRKITEHL